MVYTVCYSPSDQRLQYLPFSAVWSGSTLFAFPSKQYNQGLHYFPLSGVWSGSTLLPILSSLIKFFTICHSEQFNQGLHYLPFSAVWSGSPLLAVLRNLIRVYTICHSQDSDQGHCIHCHSREQSYQGLHYLPFSAVWSGSTLFAILQNILIRISIICHSQSDQGQHYLPFSAVWSVSTIFAILS